MRLFFILFCFLPLFLSAQTTVVADTLPGRFRINSTIFVQGLGKQIVEGEESLDSAQVRGKLFESAVSAHEAFARAQQELLRVTEQTNDLRTLYARFDTAGYYKRVGDIYLPFLVGTNYREKYANQASLNVEFRETAQKRIVFRRNGSNFNIRMLSSYSFIILACYKNAAGQTVDVTFYRASPTRFEGILDNKTIRINRI